VAQIGEEILARVEPPALSKAEGLNIPDQRLPRRTRSAAPGLCAAKDRNKSLAQGATASRQREADPYRPGHRPPDRHTLLRPDAHAAEILKRCAKKARNTNSPVCAFNPLLGFPLVAAELAGSPVKVCTVVGIPRCGAEPQRRARSCETRGRATRGSAGKSTW